MSANDYLKEILRKYDKNHTYNQYEENAFNCLKNIISEWFNNSGSVNSAYSYYYKQRFIHSLNLFTSNFKFYPRPWIW